MPVAHTSSRKCCLDVQTSVIYSILVLYSIANAIRATQDFFKKSAGKGQIYFMVLINNGPFK